ncbi:hypothetical protein [Palleronia pelagia]|uniref:Uncharacterized protein n=1 Tax=Palleronia pelagia TaxID=387096 RepID=A0A1H8ER14_9RHOB|nr:hypothetical protein [Palleronia pelagia]SEN21816.1 hypothetical protein SAMN04488011_10364 [Palleronia pelagia]
MIRAAIFGALVACLAAGPALALSCRAPDVVRSYLDADASDDFYTVVLGRIRAGTPISSHTPSRDLRIAARMRGRALGPDGFARPIARPVQLNITCLSEWCGQPPPQDRDLLIFLRHEDGRLVLDLGPCPQWLFQNPNSEQVARVADCHTGGACDTDG